MQVFIAGIMQGSLVDPLLHDQNYRALVKSLLARHLPEAVVYDPLAEHGASLAYDDATGRAVFLRHNAMCRGVDVLVAFVPQASMGTAIEMWEAYQHGAAVLTVSPLAVNWTVRYLSHAVYADLAEFEGALAAGEVRRVVAEVLARRPAALTARGAAC